MTRVTDISRYPKTELVAKTVTTTDTATIKTGCCMTRSYYTGTTDDGE